MNISNLATWVPATLLLVTSMFLAVSTGMSEYTSIVFSQEFPNMSGAMTRFDINLIKFGPFRFCMNAAYDPEYDGRPRPAMTDNVWSCHTLSQSDVGKQLCGDDSWGLPMPADCAQRVTAVRVSSVLATILSGVAGCLALVCAWQFHQRGDSASNTTAIARDGHIVVATLATATTLFCVVTVAVWTTFSKDTASVLAEYMHVGHVTRPVGSSFVLLAVGLGFSVACATALVVVSWQRRRLARTGDDAVTPDFGGAGPYMNVGGGDSTFATASSQQHATLSSNLMMSEH